MTIRDVQASFTDSALPYVDVTGAAATFLAPNSIDTSPLGAYLTEQTANDTQLSGNVNTGRDLGGGEPMWLCVDWIVAPTGGTACQSQLITSAAVGLGTPTILIDLTAVVIATLTKGYRQLIKLPRRPDYLQWLGFRVITTGTMTAGQFMAFLTLNPESSTVEGYASGFSIK